MIALVVVLLAASATLLINNFNDQVIAGEVNDPIILERNNLKVCCTYLDESGQEKTCAIQERFDCSVCEPKCSLRT